MIISSHINSHIGSNLAYDKAYIRYISDAKGQHSNAQVQVSHCNCKYKRKKFASIVFIVFSTFGGKSYIVMVHRTRMF